MKGIILAGGLGTRLFPVTKSVSKQLLPIYDKPMIYYPLSILMLANIKEILIISTPVDLPSFQKHFGKGDNIGLKIEYMAQPTPAGLAQAFILGKNFIRDDNVCLVLGDNIFYGNDLVKKLNHAAKNVNNNNLATVFGYHVKNPQNYGVLEIDSFGKVVSIEEKPNQPRSNYAVTGLYFYPNDVIKKASEVTPSKRGELEITSINQMYLKEGNLKVQLMGRGYTWFDSGTHQSLLEASNFIEFIESRHGLKIACLEEIAFKKGYINKNKLIELAEPISQNQYGKYLIQLSKGLI